jgi:hypothetical protein
LSTFGDRRLDALMGVGDDELAQEFRPDRLAVSAFSAMRRGSSNEEK